MESKGHLTPKLQEYYDLALEAHLDCPLGRAIYARNQMLNGRVWDRQNFTILSELDLLKRAKLETAKRWLAHWRKGGSIKHLCYTRLQWNKILRDKRRVR